MLTCQVRQSFILLVLVAAFNKCNVTKNNRHSNIVQYDTKLPITTDFQLTGHFTTIAFLPTDISDNTRFSIFDRNDGEKFTISNDIEKELSRNENITTVLPTTKDHINYKRERPSSTSRYHVDLSTTNINNLSQKEEPTTQTGTTASHTVTTSYPIGQNDEMTTTETSVSHEMYMTGLRKSDTCIASGMCEVASRNTLPFCNCDDLCVLFNDCCVESGKIRTHSEYKFTCSKPSTYTLYRGFQVITQCPENMTGSDIDLKCREKNIVTLGPWVIDKDGLVYQNIFCARCYGKTVITSFSIVITTLSIEIMELLLYTNMTSIENIYNRWGTDVTQIPPKDIDVRQCIIYNTDHEKNSDCDNYHINPVSVLSNAPTGIIYKNQYCLPDDGSPHACLGQYDFPVKEGGDPHHSLYALSCLYFPKKTDEDCLHENGGFCLTGAALKDYVFNIFVGLVSHESWTWHQIRQLLISLLFSLPTEISLEHFFCDKDTNILGKIVARCHINIKLKQQMEFRVIKEYKKIKWHNFVTGQEFAVLDAYIVPIPHAFSSGQLLMLPAGTFSYSTYENVTMLTDRLNTTCFDIETQTEFIDGRMLINQIKCVKNASIRLNHVRGNVLKISITYGGMIISVIALIISVIIHRITGMFKSVPGSNVENISVSLLVFNILFLVGVGANDVSAVCYTVGVCLQYVWLLVFSFKSVTLVYMWYNLTRISNTSHSFVKVRKRNATILGVALPLPIVVTTIIMDKSGLLGIYAHYGDSVCFPTGYPANVIFVSTPIGLSVFINVICLISIGSVIMKQSIVSKGIRKTSSYKHFPVFARISAVTGIFWIVGVVWEFYRYEIIEYLFLITCSFQGLLIAIANLSTKRVTRSLSKHSKTSSS